MKTERRRLMRLQRLERLRSIAWQTAAVESAQAEGTLAQLLALAERTRTLATDYVARRGGMDGAALRRLTDFAGGLHAIAVRTLGDADTARGIADDKLAALATAERRRAAMEERVRLQARRIGKAGESPAVGVRRPIGTGLE